MVTIFDTNGRVIKVGDDVKGGGRVIGIIEPEGDYNSFGRAVMYGPYVQVMFGGLIEDSFGCTPESYTDYTMFTCDDVTVVP